MYNILYTQFGSHIYGTNTPQSDLDYKGIFIPSAREIICNTAKDSIVQNTGNDKDKNSKEDIDIELFSVKKYLHLLKQGQTVALDVLFTPETFYVSEADNVWYYIKKHTQQLLHKGSTLAFIGYCKNQANKYGIKGSRANTIRAALSLVESFAKGVENPKEAKLFDHWDIIESFAKNNQHTSISYENKKEHEYLLWEVCGKKLQHHNSLYQAIYMFSKMFDEYGQRALLAEKEEGIDWKSLMHAVRVINQAKELLIDHHITFPRPEKELLLKIRKGELPYKEVAELIEQGVIDVERASSVSTLPENPNESLYTDILYNIYYEAIQNT